MSSFFSGLMIFTYLKDSIGNVTDSFPIFIVSRTKCPGAAMLQSKIYQSLLLAILNRIFIIHQHGYTLSYDTDMNLDIERRVVILFFTRKCKDNSDSYNIIPLRVQWQYAHIIVTVISTLMSEKNIDRNFKLKE